MDNKKHIVNLESFREMLHICPRLPNQPFVEPPFEEETLAFLWFLGHGGSIRWLTDVNINKLHQPWRSFVAIINKCLTEKSSGYDSEHKDTKKRNDMYYPRFTKVIIHHFMSKDPSIPIRNKVNWHYVRDDHMFTTIKLVSRHQNTQQFGAMLLIELTNANIKNSDAYNEYYAVAIGATPPKPKASVWKIRSIFDTTVTPPTAAAAQDCLPLLKANNQLQPLKLRVICPLIDEGTGTILGVLDVPTNESEEEISWNSTDEEGDDDDDDEGDDGDEGEEGNDDDNDAQDDDAQDDNDQEDEGNEKDD
nr:hypothetical protein [Tanacetum cinerariifolium]